MSKKKKKSNIITITAKDCLAFRVDEKVLDINHKHVLSEFVHHFSKNSVFNFSTNDKQDKISFKDEPFASLDYIKNEWVAGRWVGSANVKQNNTEYIVEVKPRFTNLVLLKMIERIFSINILNSFNKDEIDNNNISSILDKLLPYIWTNKLGTANKYGVPRHSQNIYHKGATIKGKLDVRKSIIPLFRQKEVVSVSKEKLVNETIAQIILQAKQLLERKLDKNFYKKNDSAYNAILNFETAGFQQYRITEYEYQKIQYKSIYQSYKDIVDFSWQILKHKNLNQDSDNENKGFSLFVDMAEIWELYLSSLLKTHFSEWHVESPKINIYSAKSYSRLIIPDIVMSKGNNIVIFDAKWKTMKYMYNDYDRTDFFQIHTYISYYQNIDKKNIAIAGLVYPLSEKYKNEISEGLFGHINNSIKFAIEGIDLNEIKSTKPIDDNIRLFEKSEKEFIDRIYNLLEQNTNGANKG
jgi:5-methylcytosine-specific restriction enzyme subunit McrC